LFIFKATNQTTSYCFHQIRNYYWIYHCRAT
jgi:hypothetical protein